MRLLSQVDVGVVNIPPISEIHGKEETEVMAGQEQQRQVS